MPMLHTQAIDEVQWRAADAPWRQLIHCDAPGADLAAVRQAYEDHQPHKIVLAEGDSWFDKFTPIPSTGTNLLEHVKVPFHGVVIDTAHIGDTSAEMVSGWQERQMRFLLDQEPFDAILLSAGGNDLIDLFADVFRTHPNATTNELMNSSLYADFHMKTMGHIQKFIGWRDASKNPRTRAAPLIVHGYDYLQPRPAPAQVFVGSRWGRGPWIYPMLNAKGMNGAQMLRTLSAVVDELNSLLRLVIAPMSNVWVIDSRGTLTPAPEGSTGNVEDWADEIHPSAQGFRKLAQRHWDFAVAKALGWSNGLP